MFRPGRRAAQAHRDVPHHDLLPWRGRRAVAQCRPLAGPGDRAAGPGLLARAAQRTARRCWHDRLQDEVVGRQPEGQPAARAPRRRHRQPIGAGIMSQANLIALIAVIVSPAAALAGVWLTARLSRQARIEEQQGRAWQDALADISPFAALVVDAQPDLVLFNQLREYSSPRKAYRAPAKHQGGPERPHAPTARPVHLSVLCSRTASL
jgi:hypothetical protein